MTAAYVADTDALGLGRPDAEPMATQTIGPIVELIAALVDSGHAYAADGDVYFAVRSWERYGELSHRDPADMDQGEEAGEAARKRDPLDFALWKGTKPGEDTAWDSPWGRGRPGWHIECSAMAEAELGLEFAIHGGGTDLVFPHHENEAAQTAAARGRRLARLWMHNGMVQVEAEKMAKSVGNVFALHEALERFGRDTLVMYFCEGHYRQPIAYSEERLQQAAGRVARIREAARRIGPGAAPPALAGAKERFFDALAADFNTPAALAALGDWMRGAAEARAGLDDFREMLWVLGLDNLIDEVRDERPEPAALELLERRTAARAARDFAEADRLREELRALGWEVRDLPSGPELVRAG